MAVTKLGESIFHQGSFDGDRYFNPRHVGKGHVGRVIKQFHEYAPQLTGLLHAVDYFSNTSLPATTMPSLGPPGQYDTLLGGRLEGQRGGERGAGGADPEDPRYSEGKTAEGSAWTACSNENLALIPTAALADKIPQCRPFAPSAPDPPPLHTRGLRPLTFRKSFVNQISMNTIDL